MPSKFNYVVPVTCSRCNIDIKFNKTTLHQGVDDKPLCHKCYLEVVDERTLTLLMEKMEKTSSAALKERYRKELIKRYGMKDNIKRMDNDDPWLVSLEPVIDDIVKTKNIDEIEKKVLALEQRFHEGQGLLNSIKKIILQAFVIELKSNIDKAEKERVKNAIIKLFGFDMI